MMAQTEDSRLFAAHMKLLDHGSVSQDLHEVSGTPLFTKKVLDHSENLFSQYGFLAGISNILDSNAAMNLSTSRPSRPADPRLFFNISAPSSAFICGSQGSGKSHTLSCLLENCLMKSDVSKLDNPLAGLVFHYDSFTSDVKGTPCEAAHISSNPNVKVRVLVSPTNLQTMKRTYAGLNVTVEPLRINQTDLNTKRMFDLMVVDQEGGKMPLYLHAISRILREMHLKQQQSNTGFNYREFKRQVDLCDMTPHQLLPLNQRLDTLESFMPRSQTSVKPLAQSNISGGNEFFGSNWSIKAGTLTIVDLSCPCVTAEGACALFNMCLSLFLEQHTTIGRVIGLDEAHKYMNAGAEASSLTDTLLSAIRLQRHLGTRVFISTQEPTISPKLLDLCSMTIVHRFTSPDWLRELKNHLASLDHDEDSPEKSNIRLMKIFNDIVKLRVGEAFLFAPSAIVGVEKRHNLNGLEETEMNRLGNGYLKIKVRARVTSDGGKSVFALGAEPTIKTEGNMFGFPAAKPVHGVPQAGSGAVGGIKPATSLFQFPSTKGLNNSVLAASSAAVIATSGSSQPATDFGAPSPTLAHISIFGSRNSQATSNVALFAGIDKGNFDPFKSAERTTIGGTFTTRTPSIFSIFSFSTVPAPGTRCAPFQPFVEKEPNSTTNQQNAFQSIGFQLPYTKFSPEELRLADYVVGVRYSGQWKFEGQFK
ncbi:hypothetical protein N431DRAFT_149871 [Stipitochalara longipes BDJ]|nr:hypothetical protein N431DRAFT_149871 [Stipitochalara longipes BDJ]